MYNAFNPFDPDAFNPRALKDIADNIKEYIRVISEFSVLPKDEYSAKKVKRRKEALKIIQEELIPKLEKGKRSVFNAPEEWNSLE